MKARGIPRGAIVAASLALFVLIGLAISRWLTDRVLMSEYLDQANRRVLDDADLEAFRLAVSAHDFRAADAFLRHGVNVDAMLGTGDTVFLWLASKGDKEGIEYLISSGADVNVQDSSGYTALHVAAATGSLDVCRVLVDHGADRAATTIDGRTPEDVAAGPAAAELRRLLRPERPATQ